MEFITLVEHLWSFVSLLQDLTGNLGNIQTRPPTGWLEHKLYLPKSSKRETVEVELKKKKLFTGWDGKLSVTWRAEGCSSPAGSVQLSFAPDQAPVGLSKPFRGPRGHKRETSVGILATTVTLLQFLKPASGISQHFTLNQMRLTEQVRVTRPLCKKKKRNYTGGKLFLACK